jgi:hypothetical protein
MEFFPRITQWQASTLRRQLRTAPVGRNQLPPEGRTPVPACGTFAIDAWRYRLMKDIK